MVMRNKRLGTIWGRLESCWPVVIGGEHLGLAVLRQRMQDFLAQKSLAVQGFSHFGVVVSNLDASLASLTELTGWKPQEARRDWVEAYQVYVVRSELEGTELELVTPAGESFFAEFLRDHGEGLHHLSFRVADIDKCLAILKASGVDLIDEKACSGSHGKVGFLKPGQFDPLYLELCQFTDIDGGND